MLKSRITASPTIGIVAGYVAAGTAWILLSDFLLLRVLESGELQAAVQTWKGLFFVLGTAAILFLLLERARSRRQGSDQRFDTFTRNLPGVVYRAEAGAGRPMIRLSEGVEGLTGHPRGDLLRSGPLPFERLIVDEDVGGLREEVAAALTARRGFQIEYRLRTRGGETRCVLDCGQAVEVDGETVIEGFIADQTRLKRLEENVSEAERLESMGRVAAAVAHDFNNLITALVGYSDLALAELGEKGMLQGNLADDLREIRGVADRARGLTSQLLAFGRRQPEERRVVDLNATVSRSERLLSQVLGPQVELATRTSPEPLPVRIDPARLEQVLLNLAVNARDAMPGGGRVDLALATCSIGEGGDPERDLPSGRFAEVTLHDTGHGMDEATRRRVFEPFFTTKERGRGTGLGLSAVYGIVREHGGGIALDSTPGKGTTFRILLPLVEVVGGPLTPGERPDEALVPEPSPARSPVILLAEDEEQIRHLSARALAAAGFEVVAASDGEEALRLAASLPQVDVLVTDSLMPGMSGREVAEGLRHHHPGARVVFISGDIEALLPLEGATTLGKPFRPRQLIEMVSRALE